jgi:hypothetical protein
MHWCNDETVAVVTFFSGLPFAWRWFRAKVWATCKKLRAR